MTGAGTEPLRLDRGNGRAAQSRTPRASPRYRSHTRCPVRVSATVPACQRLCPMNILAFDTCFDARSAAACAGGGEVHSLFETGAGGHAERIVPMIGEVLRRAGLTPGDVTRIAVTAGPGSFSGTRTGIAAARALSLALSVPAVTATSLAVMAHKAAAGLGTRRAPALLAAAGARPDLVYAQLFGADGLSPLSPPLLLTPHAAARLGGSGPLTVAGPGAEAVVREARHLGRDAHACFLHLQPEADVLLSMAARLVPASAPPAPLYLREADAKPQGAPLPARV